MIPLPTMNRICKYWNLPSEFQEACDYYFLRNYSDQDFVSLISIHEGNPVIQEYGINFQLIFQGEAAAVYTKNGERDKRKEPNNTFYWCSFRSLTFEFAGKKETKSFVLVQVDKKAGVGEKRDSLELNRTASGEAGAIHPQNPNLPKDPEFKRNNKILLHGMNYGMGGDWLRKTFSHSDAISEYERLKDARFEEDERGESQ